MHDPRIDSLSRQIVGYSTAVQHGEHVLLDLHDVPDAMGVSLIREVRAAGAIPFVNVNRTLLMRELYREAEEKQFEIAADIGIHEMKHMDCYIAIRGVDNMNELSDVPADKKNLVAEKMRPLLNHRINNTRWCVLRWPTASMAQSAGMSTEAFEDFFFRVCLLDYGRLHDGMKRLEELMTRTKEVQITGEGTDLSFSVEGIPAMACGGHHNIPDGECFTAPVRDSVQGHVTYNAPTIYHGTAFDGVYLAFRDGRIVEARANQQEALEKILDTDEGARFIGEFALGFNPEIREPMRDILFDEKIAGSFHFTPGQAYEVADNSNRSAVHWDLVKIQRPEYGGGEIRFDGEVIRQDGLFLREELQSLNGA